MNIHIEERGDLVELSIRTGVGISSAVLLCSVFDTPDGRSTLAKLVDFGCREFGWRRGSESGASPLAAPQADPHRNNVVCFATEAERRKARSGVTLSNR